MGVEFFVLLGELPELAPVRTSKAEEKKAAEEERDVTPKAEESRLVPSAVCPPAPRKRRPAKRKETAAEPPNGFCPVPKDLASLFLALPSKKLRVG
ncbi:hypothetical protein KSP40_PGU004520 [Platanthera guangdongensis]|uniref:Uncharacterized protein n=1 Tax=Platanthera guangdongensis TaxID=2320717 RepID=A0ABR2MLN7_9ASPA